MYEGNVMVEYVRTSNGWVNVYVVDGPEHGRRVSLPPETFRWLVGGYKSAHRAVKTIPAAIAQEVGLIGLI
ncbi:hypothetical protein [Bacillus sp. FJAT-52991]|uniref:Uncharacterized protein n=1 Tax=Bacillus kandeliae TaxID=3129297 RepID=A0ABZ2N998_9BACI